MLGPLPPSALSPLRYIFQFLCRSEGLGPLSFLSIKSGWALWRFHSTDHVAVIIILIL